MSVLTDAQLSVQAQQIKNETTKNANTAVRVGTMLQNIIDSKSPLPIAWNHTAQGGPPTDLTKMYYATDPAESAFPVGTLFWTDGTGGWLTK